MRTKQNPLRKNWILYAMLAPMLLWYLLFCYTPMIGVVTAFQDYSAMKGFFDSPFVGLKHFKSFFDSEYFMRSLRNTLAISLTNLLFAFPAPILLAILLNELGGVRYKKTVQTIIYMPHFISVVVICSLVRIFISPSGVINEVIGFFGVPTTNFLNDPKYFRGIYVISGIWQNVGWDSIIYIAALAGVDPELYDAAVVDGAGRLQRILNVSIPGILPTITILLILRVGNMLSVGWEKIVLLYNPGIYETADTISTFVYRRGLVDGRYSFASAVGLFNSVCNFVLLITADFISKKLGQSGLF